MYNTGNAIRTSEVMMMGGSIQSNGPDAYSALGLIDGGRVTRAEHYYDPTYSQNERDIVDGPLNTIGGDFEYRHSGGDGSVNLIFIDGHAGNLNNGEVLVCNVRADPPPGLVP